MKVNRNKLKTKKLVKIVIAVIFLSILILRFYPIGFGATGLRPETHGCIGIKLHSATVHRYFPDGNMYIGGFQYWVDDDKFMFFPDKFCLGKDVSYGK